jgi:hypothetical protein
MTHHCGAVDRQGGSLAAVSIVFASYVDRSFVAFALSPGTGFDEASVGVVFTSRSGPRDESAPMRCERRRPECPPFPSSRLS